MQYKRVTITGASYFFTVTLTNRQSQLLTENIPLLRDVIRHVRQTHPFTIDAIVILPEHIHCIWTMPKEDSNYAMRWSLIKSNFSRQIPQFEPVNASRASKRERGLWQRRYWEHCIRDQEDFNNHVDYIHINPVKHGYVLRASDWMYSSIHQYIRKGILTKDWVCEVLVEESDYGE